MVNAVIMTVSTFQLMCNTAIAPTTHDPASPTGKMTTREGPKRRESANSTINETPRLKAVDSINDSTSPERTL